MFILAYLINNMEIIHVFSFQEPNFHCVFTFLVQSGKDAYCITEDIIENNYIS